MMMMVESGEIRGWRVGKVLDATGNFQANGVMNETNLSSVVWEVL